MNAPDYFVPDENEVKEYELLPFIDFINIIETINKEKTNSEETSDITEPVRLIIINNDNDVKINEKFIIYTSYSNYLSYKEIKYFKIGELK